MGPKGPKGPKGPNGPIGPSADHKPKALNCTAKSLDSNKVFPGSYYP